MYVVSTKTFFSNDIKNPKPYLLEDLPTIMAYDATHGYLYRHIINFTSSRPLQEPVL